MRFWAITLRILGSASFVWAVINQLRLLFGQFWFNGLGWSVATSILEATIFTAVCFAAAAALMKLEQMDERITLQMSRQSAALARMLMALPSEIDPKHQRSEEDYQPRAPRAFTDADLAPVAPNWPEINPRPSESEKDSGYEQRMERRGRYRVRRTAEMRHTKAAARALIEDIKQGDDNQDDHKRPVYPSKRV